MLYFTKLCECMFLYIKTCTGRGGEQHTWLITVNSMQNILTLFLGMFMSYYPKLVIKEVASFGDRTDYLAYSIFFKLALKSGGLNSHTSSLPLSLYDRLEEKQ